MDFFKADKTSSNELRFIRDGLSFAGAYHKLKVIKDDQNRNREACRIWNQYIKPEPQIADDAEGCQTAGELYCKKKKIARADCKSQWQTYKSSHPKEVKKLTAKVKKCKKEMMANEVAAALKVRPVLNIAASLALEIGKSVGAISEDVTSVPQEHCLISCNDVCTFPGGTFDMKPFAKAFGEARGMIADGSWQSPMASMLARFFNSKQRKNCPHKITKIGADISSWKLNEEEYCKAETKAFPKRREATLMVLKNQLLSDCQHKEGPAPTGTFVADPAIPRAVVRPRVAA